MAKEEPPVLAVRQWLSWSSVLALFLYFALLLLVEGGSDISKLERIEYILGLDSPIRRSLSRACMQILLGLLISVSPAINIAHGETPWSSSAFFMDSALLALGLMVVCMGVGDLLYARRRTSGRLLKVAALLVLGPLEVLLFAPYAYLNGGMSGVIVYASMLVVLSGVLLVPRLLRL